MVNHTGCARILTRKAKCFYTIHYSWSRPANLLYRKQVGNLTVNVAPMQQQRSESDCGLFATAVCTAVAMGEDLTLRVHSFP